MALVGLCAWPYTVDDAYIIARYARRIAGGWGYTFTPGAATDGVTGPLWLLPGVLASWLGLDPVAIAKLGGLLGCSAAAYLSLRQLGQRAGGPVLGVLGCGILICQPGLGGSGVSGLETGAATLALTVAAGAALNRPRPQLRLLGTSVAGLAWLRPELAIAALVLLLAATQRAGRTRSWVAWSLAALGAMSVCAFRFWLSGSLLPLAWSAKSGTLGDGLFYATRALIVQTGGLGLALIVAGAWLGQARERWLLAVLGAHTVAIVLAGGDWMPGFRLFVPVTPLYAQLAAVGAAALLRRAAVARVAAGIALAFACGVPLLDLATRIPQWRDAGRSRDEIGSLIAADLRAHSRRIALVDIGYLGYASGREVIDLAGITEPAVASFQGGHLNKQIDLAWLERRAPDTLVLHSSAPPLAATDGRLTRLHGYPVEQRLIDNAWVLRTFRVVAVHRYAPSYYYAVLRRRDGRLGYAQ